MMAGKSQTKIEALGDDKMPDKEPAARKSSSSTPRKSSQKAENDLRGRLADCFDRIAEALDGRGDTELAGIIQEDSEVMAAGLVSMTRPLKALRTPLLVLIAVIEPLLAFGRIGRVLVGRIAERRMEAQHAQEGHEAAMRDGEYSPTQ